jgi:hypothetical protein
VENGADLQAREREKKEKHARTHARTTSSNQALSSVRARPDTIHTALPRCPASARSTRSTSSGGAPLMLPCGMSVPS